MPITKELLHDALQDRIQTVVREAVDQVTARVTHRWGHVPDIDMTAAVAKDILAAMAALPGEHWLPDDGE